MKVQEILSKLKMFDVQHVKIDEKIIRLQIKIENEINLKQNEELIKNIFKEYQVFITFILKKEKKNEI